MNQPIEQTHAPDKKKDREFRTRFFILKLFFALFFVAVSVRLTFIQVVESYKYKSLARKQYEQKFVLPATRGKIFDREGNVLVSNTMYVSFAADPAIIGDNAKEVAATFAKVFDRPISSYLEKLEGSKRFIWLERRVRPELAKKIEAAGHIGIVPMNEPKRLYHYDEVGGSLLGFTDVDNKGISGIELQLDDELRGTSGSVVLQRDGLGRTRPSADFPRMEPVNGRDVALTINLKYQAIVEEELHRGIVANKADGGLAVMLNPKTGEILALSTYPGVNPNEYSDYDLSTPRNRVITDVFEPGSVFKVVTASAVYENKLVNPNSRYNAEHGTMKIFAGNRVVRKITDTHVHDWLTFQEAIEVSSNIVMAKVSKLIGPEKFYRQARDFGFGILSSVDLPGEVRGRLKKPNEWSGTSLMTMSYGYEVGVTPLQIAAAYAAVANNGYLMRPYVLSKVFDANGDVVREQRPQKIRQVISEQTAVLLTQAFEGAVERGTAMEVKIDGIRIAGKTGTSRKIVDGKYTLQDYTASFVGYFPVEDPQIVCLVMMDNPRARGYYGGVTSGPIFRSIAERMLHSSAQFSRPFMTQDPKNQKGPTSLPDVRTIKLTLAQKILEGHGLNVKTFGKGDIVVRQSPEPGKQVQPGDGVTLVLNSENAPQNNGMTVVPNLRGMSMRRAINRLVIDEYEIRVQGSGVVVQQLPAPGQQVKTGTAVLLVCEPRAAYSAVLY